MRANFLFAAFFLLCTISLKAQSVLIYDGPSHGLDQARVILTDNNNNIYVTGNSYSNANKEDYLTIKYNSTGTVLWTARYDGVGHDTDIPYAMAIDAAGNVYVTGSSKQTTDANTEDYLTVKYNSAGVLQWDERYDGPNDCHYSYDVARAIDVDASGNVYITGSSRSVDYNDDIITVKYSPNGTFLWFARYNGPSSLSDIGTCLKLDGSGNVIVAGSSVKTGFGYDYVVLKYNNNGTQQWVKRYSGPGNGDDSISAMVLDNQGNIYVTGTSKGVNTGMDYATVKFNSAAGDTAWVARFTGPGNATDYATAITKDNFGAIYVTGATTSAGGNLDYATLRYGPDGALLWVSRYNGTGNSTDIATDIKVMNVSCGGFIQNVPCFRFKVFVTGQSTGLGSMKDYLTVEYDDNGNQTSFRRFNGAGNNDDIPSSMAVVTSTNSIYVTGTSNNNYGTLIYNAFDFPESPLNVNGSEPSEFALKQNYPNPFNPATIISFSMPRQENVKLRVYDPAGKLVETLLEGNLSEGIHSVSWDASKFNSGIYFYSIVAGSFSETRKMVLIK